MATRLAWFLNFDADLELRAPARYRTSPEVLARASALAAQLADLVAPDDVLLDAGWSGPLAPDLTIQTFCPTPYALGRIRALGLRPPHAPRLEVLRRVNDRRFCAELGHGLPEASFVDQLDVLEAWLAKPSFSGSYVLKRAFSFAGREQRRVRGGLLDESTRGFAVRSFGRGEGLQVEPWVERLVDVSRHGYLTRAGTLLVGETREQRCDAMGRFLGMSGGGPGLSADEERTLLDALRATGAALTRAEYFGPFGIDGFRYRGPGGESAFNPRCEINARLTMGYSRDLLLRGHQLDAAEGS